MSLEDIFEDPFADPLEGPLPAVEMTTQAQTPYIYTDEWLEGATYSWWISWSTDPYGYVNNVNTWMGDLYGVDMDYSGPAITYAEVEDADFAYINFPTTIGELQAADLYASSLYATSVGSFEGDDLYFSNLYFDDIYDDSQLDDSQYVYWSIGGLYDDLEIDDGYDITLSVSYSYDAEILVDDTNGLDAYLGDFLYSQFGVYESSDVNVWVENGHGSIFAFDEVEGGSLMTEQGEVITYVEDSNDILVDHSRNHDRTETTIEDSGEQGEEVIVLGGSNDDRLNAEDSMLAYNLGNGNDTAMIEGGETVGNMVDGEVDEIIFNVNAGGDHALQHDDIDIVMLEIGDTEFSAAALDAIDGTSDYGADGFIEWDDFTLAYVPIETYDDLKG